MNGRYLEQNFSFIFNFGAFKLAQANDLFHQRKGDKTEVATVVCVTDLDFLIEKIILESLLTTLEMSLIF